MNRTVLGVAAVALVSVLATSPASAGANFVTNGGFETGSFSGWTVSSVAGTTSFNTDATEQDFVAPDFGPGSYHAADGQFEALLGDRDASKSGSGAIAAGSLGSGATITQTITAAPGQGLLLSYYIAGDGYAPNALEVKWNGTVISGSAITNVAASDYVEYQFWVKTTGTTTDQLQFVVGDPQGYLSLDNVSLEVPEPASLALLGSGLLAGAVAFGRRRRSVKKS